MIKTEGTAGIGATFLDTSGVEYAFTVTKNGELLGTFYNIPIICEDIISQKCELNLYASLSTSYMFDFSTEDNLAYTIDFNETTRTITIIFSTLDNSASTIQLNVTKYDNYENLSLCSNSVTSSSGTLVCSIASGYGNLSIIGKLYKDSTLVTYRIYTIAAKAKDILGNNTFFFVFMIFIILPLLLISSPIGALVMGAIGIILAIVLFGISTTLIGTASFLGFLLVIIIIVIAKWVQRGND